MTKRSLTLKWDPSLVVLGVGVLVIAISCTLSLAEEVRNMHARMRFERKTNIPTLIHVLSAITLTLGIWVSLVIFTLAMDVENARVDFDPGITVASAIAPFPVAVIALALLAETARGAGQDASGGQGARASISTGQKTSKGLGHTWKDISRALKGSQSISGGYLTGATVVWAGCLCVAHFVLVEALQVPETSRSYDTGVVIGGVVASLALTALGMWVACALKQVPAQKEIASLLLAAGVIVLYFTAMMGTDFEVDDRFFDPVSKQSLWSRHYIFGVSAICSYNLVNVLTVIVASTLSRKTLYNNHFLGAGIGIASSIALDFAYGSRGVQLPVVVVVGLVMASALTVSGIGPTATLGFSSGFGYALGPFTSEGWLGLVVGLSGMVAMTAITFSGMLTLLHVIAKLSPPPPEGGWGVGAK
eukprot:Hpha_TRINITY_DN15562_c1_g13::TRINITY_DN15562_c1_g13_i1::g.103847::m.103847